MDSQFDDPEQSYRRGYDHGVSDVLAAVRNRLSAQDSAALEEWYSDEVKEWRSDALQGLSNRAKWPDPFPAGVRPPRDKLRLALPQTWHDK
jgi:hypothetical protein